MCNSTFTEKIEKVLASKAKKKGLTLACLESERTLQLHQCTNSRPYRSFSHLLNLDIQVQVFLEGHPNLKKSLGRIRIVNEYVFHNVSVTNYVSYDNPNTQLLWAGETRTWHYYGDATPTFAKKHTSHSSYRFSIVAFIWGIICFCTSKGMFKNWENLRGYRLPHPKPFWEELLVKHTMILHNWCNLLILDHLAITMFWKFSKE